MSDQNTGTGTSGQAAGANGEATEVKLYATRAECEAAKPADATKNHKVFTLAKGGVVTGYLWARGYDNALALVARIEGFSASLGSTTPVTKEAVLAKLATFTDDELTALGLARAKPARTTRRTT